MDKDSEEKMKDRLLESLEEGERSGFVEFDPEENLSELHGRFPHRPETK